MCTEILHPELKKTSKEILLETFRVFIDICNKNNLKYVCAYGTALGAVRHQGMIPWDDDIDIHMLRGDYERLFEIVNSSDDLNYEIVDYHQKGYYLPFAKFTNKNTTIWEVEEYPFILGSFVDIFPLDEFSVNGENIDYDYCNKLWYNVQRSCMSSSLRKIFKGILSLNGSLSFHEFKNYCHKLWWKSYVKKYDAIINLVKKQQGDYYKCYSSCFNDLRYDLLKKEWIDHSLRVIFEGFEVDIPYDYDAYLSHIYGDYLKLPPQDSRVSNHFQFYVNYEKRLSVEDILKIKGIIR